eukprot:766540-Hanusia_phi.AAC.1
MNLFNHHELMTKAILMAARRFQRKKCLLPLEGGDGLLEDRVRGGSRDLDLDRLGLDEHLVVLG